MPNNLVHKVNISFFVLMKGDSTKFFKGNEKSLKIAYVLALTTLFFLNENYC